MEIHPDAGPVVSNLVSFVDYGDADMQTNDLVLMRAGNLYLHYNRAKGYNSDTPSAYRDRVVVTESAGDLEVSNFIAALSKGQSYFYPNFSGFNSLVIEVCDQMTGSYDYATVSIYVEDGIQQSNCGAANLQLESPPDAYPFNTSTTTIDTGPYIGEDAQKSEKPKNPVVGIVWGAVAFLFLVALYLIYRIRSHQKARAAILSAKRQQAEAIRRRSWIPSTIETVSKPKEDEQDSDSQGSTRTPTSDPPSSGGSSPNSPAVEVELSSDSDT